MSISTLQQTAQTRHRTSSPIMACALAGLGGGVVFGMMMGMMGMLPMVAGLVGSSSALTGLIVHLGVSAFIGTSYGLVASRLPARTSVHLVAGIATGVVWWVLGALVMMPFMLGMSGMIFVIGSTQMMSLMGHVIYGVTTAVLFVRIHRRP